MTAALAAGTGAPPPPPPPPPVGISAPDGIPVLVLPNPKILGLANMDADWRMVSADGFPVHTHPVMPLIQAFSTDHVCDAHLTCYTIETPNGPVSDPIPRLTKPLVAGIERLRQEEDERIKSGSLDEKRAVFRHITRVVGTMLALDFDLPEHVRWTDAYRDQVQLMLVSAAKVWSMLATPTVFYCTSGGFRLVWALSEPVDVHGVGGLEDLLYGLVAKAHIAGITVDTACKDWTRLFRLPRVVRADKQPVEAKTWIQPYYAQSWGSVNFNERSPTPPTGTIQTFSPSSFIPLSSMNLNEFAVNPQAQELGEKWKLRIGAAPRDLRDTFRSIAMGEMPTAEQIQAALSGAPGQGQSAAFKQVTGRFKAQAYPRDPSKAIPEAMHVYKILVEGEDIRVLEQGQLLLHQGISKLARNLCYLLRERLGDRPTDISAQFIHSLVVQPARKANALRATDGGGAVRSEAEIDAEVWRLVKWFYQHFRGLGILTAEEAEDNARERESLQLRLIAQMGAYQEAIVKTLMKWSGSDDPVVADWITHNWGHMLMLKHGDGRSVLKFSPKGELYYSIGVKDWDDVLSIGRDSGHDLIPWTTMNSEGQVVMAKSAEVCQRYSTVTNVTSLSRLIPSSQVRVYRDTDNVYLKYVKSLPGIRTDIVPKYDAVVDEWLHLLGGDDAEILLDWLAAYPLIQRPLSALYLQGSPSIGKGMLMQALGNMTLNRSSAKFDEAVGDFQDTMLSSPLIWADEKVLDKRMSKSLMDTLKTLVSGEYNTLNSKGEKHMKLEGFWRVVITANHANALPFNEEVSGADLEAIRLRLIHIKSHSVTAKLFLEKQGQWAGTQGWAEVNIPGHIMHLAQTRHVDMTERFLVKSRHTQYHEDLQVLSSGSGEVLRLLGRMLRQPHTAQSCLIIKDDQVYFNVPHGYEKMVSMIKDERRPEFPKSERLMARNIRNLSIDPEPKDIRVPSNGVKQGKVLKLWRLNMPMIIDWLDKNDQDADLRHALGQTIWNRDAPDRLKQSYADAQDIGAPTKPAPPSPPPPPPLQFPTPALTGHQRIRKE